MSTTAKANKISKIINPSFALFKKRSQTIFPSCCCSTQLSSSSSSSSTPPSSSPAAAVAAAASVTPVSSWALPLSPIQLLSHKRPLSSAVALEQYDDEISNYSENDDNSNYDSSYRERYKYVYNESFILRRKSNTGVRDSDNISNGIVSNDSRTTTTTTTTENPVEKSAATRFPCGSNRHEDKLEDLPPPLPEPSYSVHKRVLPSTLIAFSSSKGKQLLMGAFAQGTAESYWKLTEHFVNQSDPAFCGVSTLLMVLNAMCIDPNVRWSGGWRYYGSEDVLLDRCCFSAERIRRKGIIMEDFGRLGRCHGLTIDLKRPTTQTSISIETDATSYSHQSHTGTPNGIIVKKSHTQRNSTGVYHDIDVENSSCSFSLDDFRNDIRSILSDEISKHKPVLVVSFSRSALNQTGDGHFSPIGAYNEESDAVLVLDVARFKYAPYWVSVTDLYRAMQEVDSVTKKPRGWFRISPPKNHECMHDEFGQENRRSVEFVPRIGDGEVCPIGAIKVHFCEGNLHRRRKRRSSILNH